MIKLENLCKGFWYEGEYRPVFEDLNITLPSGRSLALMGANGAGKSTLLQIIAGNIRPDHGRVWSDGSLSFLVGTSGSFHRDLTGAQNTRFLARVYGVDTEELSDFVQDFADIGRHYHMPLRTYSSGMKSRLTFGISMGIPFDTYLVDEVTAVGDSRFKRKSRAVFRERMKRSSGILVSHSTSDIRSFCDAGLVLSPEGLRYFEDLEEAITYHEGLMAA